MKLFFKQQKKKYKLKQRRDCYFVQNVNDLGLRLARKFCVYYYQPKMASLKRWCYHTRDLSFHSMAWAIV